MVGYCDLWRDFVYIWSQDIEFYCYVDIANRVIFLPSRNGYAPIFTFYLNGAELSPSYSENEISQDLGSTHQSSIPLLIDAWADGWWMSCKAEQLHTWCLCRGLWFMASNSILELCAKQINSCGFWLPNLHSIGFIIYIKYKEEFKAQIGSRNILTCTWRWYLPVDLSIVFYGDRFLLFQGTVLAELIVTLDQQSWGNRDSIWPRFLLVKWCKDKSSWLGCEFHSLLFVSI